MLHNRSPYDLSLITFTKFDFNLIFIALDALIEDEDEEEDEGVVDDAESKDAAKKTCPAVLKGKGFRQLIGYGQYCVCKAAQSSMKGDETEISEDDVAAHVESLAEDPKKLSKAQKKKLFDNLIKGAFRRADKCCYCTFNKRVVRYVQPRGRLRESSGGANRSKDLCLTTFPANIT